MPNYSSPYDIPPVLMGTTADELSAWASGMLSSSAAEVFQSKSGQEAIAAVTAAAVKAASDTTKEEVAKMVLPAFLAGVAVAVIIQRTKK